MPGRPLQPSLYFASKARAYQSSSNWLLTSSINIRLRRKGLPGKNVPFVIAVVVVVGGGDGDGGVVVVVVVGGAGVVVAVVVVVVGGGGVYLS